MSTSQTTTVEHNRKLIEIAGPGELAAALRAAGYEVQETPGRKFDLHTSTAVCHGGDSERKLGLSFDADRRRWTGHCLTGGCTADQDALTHAVQTAAGIPVCRCPECYSAQRRGDPPRPAPKFARRRPTAPANGNGGPAGPAQPENGADGRTDGYTSPRRNDWGAHKLTFDATAGCHCHAWACPRCERPDALLVWALAPWRFAYAGLALICDCPLTYDQLHGHIIDQLHGKGRRWRQECFYTMPDKRRRARVRTDPGKGIVWDTSAGRAETKGLDPALWNWRRGARPDCGRALIVEGEKAAAACVSAGIDGERLIMSIGGNGYFKTARLDAFGPGWEVTLWPDNDAAGIAASNTAAGRLIRLGASVRIVDLTGIPEKADAADLTVSEIRNRIHNARGIE